MERDSSSDTKLHRPLSPLPPCSMDSFLALEGDSFSYTHLPMPPPPPLPFPPHQPDSQALTEAYGVFDAAAEDLMLRLGIKATGLYQRLRNIIEAASQNLPPVRVLYCSSDGVYGYSDAFKRFRKEEQPIPDSLQSVEYEDHWMYNMHDRVRDVETITRFGQHLMERWPGIAKMVKAYMGNDLENRMDYVRSLIRNQNDLIRIQKARDSIATETGRSDGKTKWRSYDVLHNDDEDFSVYAPSTLEAIRTTVDAAHNKVTLAIQEKCGALLEHVTQELYKEMWHSFYTKLPEEVEAEKAGAVEAAKPAYFSLRSARDSEYLSFTDAIEKYGERHYAVWGAQKYFCHTAMHFLLLHPERIEELAGLASERDNAAGTLLLGLAAANGKHCKLSIAEMPSLTEWDVSCDDYGGEFVRPA